MRRRAARPAWQNPTALITAAAVVVGLVLFVVLVVRPGSTSTAPSSSDNPYGLVTPSVAIPAGLASGRSVGKADAPVTMDVWADYQCPYCSQLSRTIEAQIITNLVTKGTVRIVAHDFSFIGSGRNPDESTDAAVAARCADRQSRFWDYHEMLFWNQATTENSGGFSRDRLLAMADLLGLDHAAFQSCLSDQSLRAQVVTSTADGRTAGVTSTPTSFINGQLVLGLKDYATFKAMIDAAAAAASPAASATPASSPSPASSVVPASPSTGGSPAP